MGKMPVLWSMVVLKRIHPIPQSPSLLPYLEKVCDGSNPGLSCWPPVQLENVGTKGDGGWSQAATDKECPETPEAETRTRSPRDFKESQPLCFRQPASQTRRQSMSTVLSFRV